MQTCSIDILCGHLLNSNWWHNFTPFYRLGKGCEFSGLHAVLSDMTFELSTLSKPKYTAAVRNIVKQRDLREQKRLWDLNYTSSRSLGWTPWYLFRSSFTLPMVALYNYGIVFLIFFVLVPLTTNLVFWGIPWTSSQTNVLKCITEQTKHCCSIRPLRFSSISTLSISPPTCIQLLWDLP